MKRTAIMSRGTGFKRPERVRPPMGPLTPVTRGVVVACTGMAAVNPKTAPKRKPALLDMAKGKPCLLCIPGICRGGTDTTVACHSNLSIHGKAGARKADDQYSVWGCMACHRWLDQGPAPADVKELAFMLAHVDQVLEWRQIAAGPASKAQRATAWALDELGAWPMGWPKNEEVQP